MDERHYKLCLVGTVGSGRESLWRSATESVAGIENWSPKEFLMELEVDRRLVSIEIHGICTGNEEFPALWSVMYPPCDGFPVCFRLSSRAQFQVIGKLKTSL